MVVTVIRRDRLALRGARAVYGSIVALAVIVVLDDGEHQADEVMLAVFGAVTAATLAETYADTIAEVIRRGRHPTRAEVRTALIDSTAGSAAALITLLPFIGVELGTIEPSTAFDLAGWLGAAVIVAYAAFANRMAGLSMARSLFISAGFLSIALVLIAIKSATH